MKRKKYERPPYVHNPKAPRMGKKEFSTHLFGKALYKKFLAAHPEYAGMDWTEFQALWMDITETIRYEGVVNPLGVKLPYYLGEIKTQYLPYKFHAIDKKTSMELGVETPHLNIITRGKSVKIKWERRWAVKFNHILQFYAFEPDRRMNKLANVHIAENPEKLRVSRVTLGGRRAWKND